MRIIEERLRPWFYGEVVLGAAAFILFLITLVWNEWIELVFKVDPDAGNGSLEKTICVVLLLASSWLARTEWRRVHTPAGQLVHP